jgi:glycosyltransferase involved in cell wall biosynthesis
LIFFSSDQLLLADDGSTDRTVNVAKKKGIRIIKGKKNIGKGFILTNAFNIIIQKFPNVKWVISIDADGQHDPSDIPHFLNTIESYPEVRILVGKRNYNKMPPLNRFSNILTSRWCQYWLNWDLSDIQCGFRCYHIDALHKILQFGLSKKKFDLETEILFIAWILDIKMKELDIRTTYLNNNRKSRVRPVIDTFRWILVASQFGFSLEFIYKVWEKRYF